MVRPKVEVKFISNSNNLSIIFIMLAFLFLALYSGFKLNVFFLFDVDYTFREDNFWSYSSSIFRRGMVGEVLYNLDLLTGNSFYIFSFVIWITFLYFLFMSLVYVRKCFSLFELSAFLISPCFLLYSVDSEVFTLLPFLTLFNSSNRVRIWGTLLLIAFSISIREISLLFYFPVLVYLIVYEKSIVKVGSFFVLLLSLVCILIPKPEATFMLEDTYWADKGYSLKSHHLYLFVDMGILDVLDYHLGYFRDKASYIIIPLFCFIALLVVFFFQRTRDSIATIYLFFMVSVCFVLTIDYGRYFYLFWIYTVLSSHSKVSYMFVRPWGFITIRPNIIERILVRLGSYRVLILVFFTLAPSGYWIGVYQLTPRFMTLLNEGLWFFKSAI